ncbi:MAG: NAD(P)H-binding protein [Pseudonocardiaceae bacterium]|nr:NAD(P)H-binding protein [Pseudonocardiaceae bacterium]
MRVAIAGGHGKIALHLQRLLSGRQDTPVALIRDPDHTDDVSAAGGEPVVFDLESGGIVELAEHLEGADAVVFAAGAGPGSGVGRKDTVDRAGAALLAEAAERAGVRRYLLVGSIGVDNDDPEWAPPPDVDEVFAAYLQAKAAAERDLGSRDLDVTVLRPGRLTDTEPTGKVQLAAPKIDRGEVSRADVAAVLVALLDEPRTAGLTLELVGGVQPVAQAVRAVLGI